MSIETMITRAVLEDHFSPVLSQIAAHQDAFARKTMALNTAGNVALGVGSGILAFGVKSIKIAGQLNAIRFAMTAVEGAQKSAFDTDYIDKFAQHSQFTYLDLMEAGKRLALAGVPVKDYLGDIADLASASQKPLAQVAKLYDTMLAGGNTSLALSARGGFSQFYLTPKKIVEAAGLTYHSGMRLKDVLTPQQIADAVHKVLIETGRAGLNEKMATTTLAGTEGMLQDAMTRLEDAVGSGALPKTIGLLNDLAGGINAVATAIKTVPGVGDAVLLSGGGLVAAGAVLKGVAAWRQYSAILKIAKAAGDAERAGEAAKVPIAEAEGAAVAGTTAKWAAGAATMGLYAVAAAGLVADIYAVVGALHELGRASSAVEAAQKANSAARAQGYDVKQGHVTGFGARPVWQQYGLLLSNQLTFGMAERLHPEQYETGFSALQGNAERAAAARHGAPALGVRRQAEQAEREARAKAAQAARDARVEAANGYKLPAQLEYQIGADERKVALLEAQHAAQNKVNAAKKTEIDDLMKASALLRANAKLATDPKAHFKLLTEADEDAQKAALLGLDKKKDKGGFDGVISKILGGGGISDDEILKRTGIGRKFFAGQSKFHAAPNPLHAMIEKASKKATVIQFHVNGKVLQEFKHETVDETLKALLTMLEHSKNGPALGAF